MEIHLRVKAGLASMNALSGYAAFSHRTKVTSILIYLWAVIFICDTVVNLAVSPITMKLLGGLVFGGYGPVAEFLSLDYYSLSHYEYWRLLTYGLGHTGILHLYFNIWAVHFIGKRVEKQAGGRLTFSVLFASYLINGCLFAGLYKPLISFSPSVGTFALFGMWLVYHVANKHRTNLSAQEKSAIIILLAVNLFGVDALFVHAVGFAVGAAAGMLHSAFMKGPSQKNRATPQ